jgi:hypothetical protein
MSRANMFVAKDRVLKGVCMGLVQPGHELKLSRILVSMIGVELGEAVSQIGLEAQKGLEVERFRGKVREDIRGVSRNGVREVGDNGEAILCIGGFVGRDMDSVRKSRGRVRM